MVEKRPRTLVIPYDPQEEEERDARLKSILSPITSHLNSIIQKIVNIYDSLLFIGDIDPQYRKNKKNNIITRRKARSIKKRFCLEMRDILKEYDIKGQWVFEDRKGPIIITIEKLWDELIIGRNIRLVFLKNERKNKKLELHGPQKSDLNKIRNHSNFSDFLKDTGNCFPQDYTSIPYYKNKARNLKEYTTPYENMKAAKQETKEELRSIEQQISFLEKLPKKINISNDAFVEERKLPPKRSDPK
ncbi:hypothetical protein GS501_06535 [Saccharibacter sp. 17.LH.SD]|uniref:hypothetical protein n=1 Tax=Saccharibacter sp. 17.LH.SD TaxID=2689393 RepID=UPI00136B7652|nr:hypothetical protein [Saccharibacter sp. 17.LH.SD]MXV44699.1 hypothetical protein [Saccharibacter sp. 17.LH.SD]